MFLLDKLVHLNRKLYPGKLFHGPEWIVLGVNNNCNLHCKMCDVGIQYESSNFYQNLTGSRPLHMPFELFKRIADQTTRYYPSAKLGYAFTEPLVYKHLAESLQYASSKKLYTTITTNALNLKKVADDLVAANLNELYISLDGPADIHNEIRGYRLSFERAAEGIDYLLLKKKHPRIFLFCVITQWNIGHLKRFLSYFQTYKLSGVGFMHTNYTPESVALQHNSLHGNRYPATASNMQDIQLSDYNLDQLYDEIQEIKAAHFPFPITFSPELNSREVLQSFYHQPERFIGKRCHDAFNAIMIKSNGEVIPAHGRCYNLKIGNLYHTNLPEIWNSAVVGEFRKTLNKAGGLLPACSRCCSAFN